MSLQQDIERERRRTIPGAAVAMLAALPTTMKVVPRCSCGGPVDATLLELRQWFPSLPADLCTGCYEAAEQASAERVRGEAARVEQRQRLARLEAIVPPEMLATSTTHVAFNAALWERVRDWRPSCGRWLLITGLPGRCKTRVVALLARHLIVEDGVRVVWTTAIELQAAVEDLRSHNNGIAEAARTSLREWKHAAVLVLDDLGKNTWTPSLEARLFELIDFRKTRLLPTIVTANTPLPELLRTKQIGLERGGPIIGRILEASRGWNVEAPDF
ncbi:ATP-binding protein [Luteolibacter arcticus]|uniref:ATP-binding protein n=1 Tax=Luteolibacter arcticus TaxID=1581411 RepID=A0ABT3GSU3_9BACT|nr:ATP-binding protein [Luteolibacter arcticus]MCW1926540.1 ATP-binding protein [Luteolibacter arcticus]